MDQNTTKIIIFSYFQMVKILPIWRGYKMRNDQLRFISDGRENPVILLNN